MQAEGARLFGQVIHLGRHIDGNFARMPSWSASAVPWTATAPPPHPMTEDEIAQVIAAHAEVAANLVEAGLDGIELTMAHGHLLQQFLSPAVNRRSDAWGGSEANRMRLALECLRAVRARVGDGVAVGLRVSADEFLRRRADAARHAAHRPRALRRGARSISSMSATAPITAATPSRRRWPTWPSRADAFHHLPRGIAAALRDAGHDIPVFAVCRFRTIAEADAMLAAGDVAMVGMARAHIAEPALVRHAAEGREAEGRPCLVLQPGLRRLPGAVAPHHLPGQPARGPRGGMARAAAARRAAPARAGDRRRARGDGGRGDSPRAAAMTSSCGRRRTALGGALAWTERQPVRADMAQLLDFQRAALARAGVRVRAGPPRRCRCRARRMAPTPIVLALGAEPAGARLPGRRHRG